MLSDEELLQWKENCAKIEAMIMEKSKRYVSEEIPRALDPPDRKKPYPGFKRSKTEENPEGMTREQLRNWNLAQEAKY